MDLEKDMSRSPSSRGFAQILKRMFYKSHFVPNGKLWFTYLAVRWTDFLSSQFAFIKFMDLISRCSHEVKVLKFGDKRISTLPFADEAILL